MAYPCFLLWLLAVALTGCSSAKISNYVSPRVEGQVLAANTHQPLADVRVRRVSPRAAAGVDAHVRGGEIMEEDRSVRTDADGRFVLDGEKDVALFRHAGWYSVTVSFELGGYKPLQTNYTIDDVSRHASDGAPIVDAGQILLSPIEK